MKGLATRFAKALDFRQTEGYAKVVSSLGWQALGDPGNYLYLRYLGPLGIAKLQRPQAINFTKLAQLRKKYHLFWTYVEPGLSTKVQGDPPQKPWYVDPFAHSSTALLDLTLSEKELFMNLETGTRTKIRRAAKDLQIEIKKISELTPLEITEFLELSREWSSHRKVIGYSEKYLSHMLKHFNEQSFLLTAYFENKPVCQLLLIRNESVATAFCIFTSEEGYKLRAPLLVNWESIRYAQKIKASIFDFLGVFDPRYPKMYKRWQGFTQTKLLFKPTIISFPRSYLLLGW